MSQFRSVIIIHVPYEHRGGEDAHVDMLEKAYQELGYQVILYPADRQPPAEGRFKSALKSLTSAEPFGDLEELWNAQGQAVLHLHNVYPVLGPRLLNWIIAKKARAVMTVHNHRFYCTNGLALRDGRICKECKHSASFARPLKYNCNNDIKKSAYYAAALTKSRRQNLLQTAVTKFIAPSPYIRDELVSFGIPSDQVVHILNPIARSTQKGIAPKVDVLYAGRLSQEKGIIYLLEAIRLLPEVAFGIIGGGPLEDEVKEAERSLPNLKYYGPHPHPTVLDFIKSARIGILPSICNEILPTFVLESFNHGKRCVVPDLDSTRWLASDEFPGHRAITHDPIDLARAIKSALNTTAVSPEQAARIQAKLGFERFCSELAETLNALS